MRYGFKVSLLVNKEWLNFDQYRVPIMLQLQLVPQALIASVTQHDLFNLATQM